MISSLAAVDLRAQDGRPSYDREVGRCALRDGRDLGEVLIAEGACGRCR